ncbi:hypothetical protein Vau01_115160 [Virgisporangium aurantiacum]|uniref:Uncharacterized protein n=1 Tax=Virgisporangium aurantiacum TaxID=175570 RepID=A0A8J4E6E7_9ACTN|nr:hypothetical protein Vau01_115160 [Virgisporangium aurantiacum]
MDKAAGVPRPSRTPPGAGSTNANDLRRGGAGRKPPTASFVVPKRWRAGVLDESQRGGFAIRRSGRPRMLGRETAVHARNRDAEWVGEPVVADVAASGRPMEKPPPWISKNTPFTAASTGVWIRSGTRRWCR